MNKIMCYEVNGFQIREYEKVKSTNEFMTFIDSGGKQQKRAKNCYNAHSPKYFEFEEQAIKHVDRKRFEEIKPARDISNEKYLKSLRMAIEFREAYPHINFDKKEY